MRVVSSSRRGRWINLRPICTELITPRFSPSSVSLETRAQLRRPKGIAIRPNRMKKTRIDPPPPRRACSFNHGASRIYLGRAAAGGGGGGENRFAVSKTRFTPLPLHFATRVRVSINHAPARTGTVLFSKQRGRREGSRELSLPPPLPLRPTLIF